MICLVSSRQSQLTVDSVIKKIIYWLLFIFIDIVLWIIIGLILLNYEDNWDASKGYYFSLDGMTSVEKIAFISYYIWIVLNILLVVYVIYRLIKNYLFHKLNTE